MSCSFDPKQIRVALLAGGKSGERSISLASGEGAKEALLEAGFPVTVFDFMASTAKTALSKGFWKPSGFPISVLVFGRVPLPSISLRRSSVMSVRASLPLVL